MNNPISKLKMYFMALAGCAFLASFSVQATIVTLQFDNVGTINSIDAGSPEAALGWMVGDTLILQATFDDATPDVKVATASSGKFQDPSGFLRLINSSNNTSVTYNGGLDIEVETDERLEFETLANFGDATATNSPTVSNDIDFDTSGTPFFTNPDDLSTVVADLLLLNVFHNNNTTNISTTGYWNGLASVDGVDFGPSSPVEVAVTQVVDAAPIPEPSTYALFALGIGALGVMNRRRKARA